MVKWNVQSHMSPEPGLKATMHFWLSAQLCSATSAGLSDYSIGLLSKYLVNDRILSSDGLCTEVRAQAILTEANFYPHDWS